MFPGPVRIDFHVEVVALLEHAENFHVEVEAAIQTCQHIREPA